MPRTLGGFLLAFAIALATTLAAARPAAGQSLEVPINLPGGISADLTVSFEQVTGLSLANLGVSAHLVLPTDPGLLSRLPGTASIPIAFPVLIRIEPPAAGGLSFTGIAGIEIHTHNLLYVPNTPLRLFAAPLGGPFADITDDMGSGSYRVCGSKGGFSEFLIVVDLTPVDQVITAKFNQLNQLLLNNASLIPAPVESQLQAQLATARSAYLAGDVGGAIDDLDVFLDTVVAHSGTDIPDLWRAARDRVDVAGLLRAGGRTLSFSLGLKQEYGP